MKLSSGSSLRNLVLAALLAMSLVPLALLGFAMYRSAADALRDQAFARMEAVRTITAQSVERYFQTMREELLVAANGPLARDSVKAFRQAWQELPIDDQAVAATRQEIVDYYAAEFAPLYSNKTKETIDMRAYVGTLDPRGLMLQDRYLRRNKNPVGSKQLLDAADDGSTYSSIHAEVHPIFRDMLERYGVYDIFLIDATSGTILYTVFKEIDFGSSLTSGPLASSNLAKAFREAVAMGRPGAIAYGQYSRYLPSLMDPASFIATPLLDGDTVVGVLAFQLPLDKTNQIIGETTGLGETGETYAIGPDKMFRSNSRFAKDLGYDSTIINPKIKVDTVPVRTALETGKPGTAMGRDYRDKAVLSSWTPVTVFKGDATGNGAVRWALISEIDEAEVMAPAYRLRRFALILFGLTTAAIALYGDVLLRLVSGPFAGPFLAGYAAEPGAPDAAAGVGTLGLARLDHAVGNVPALLPAANAVIAATGFHEFAEFTAADVGTVDSGLNSVVLANNAENVLLPMNEPTFGTARPSQIQTFLDHHGGPGVQHLALKTDDAFATLRALRARTAGGAPGFALMAPASPAYYKGLRTKVGDVLSEAQLAEAEALGLLVDRDDQGVLLQIFTRPLSDRPTVFLEIIQRVGCLRTAPAAEVAARGTAAGVVDGPVEDAAAAGSMAEAEAVSVVVEQAGGCGGFGKGNFSELFKSIEDYEKDLGV